MNGCWWCIFGHNVWDTLNFAVCREFIERESLPLLEHTPTPLFSSVWVIESCVFVCYSQITGCPLFPPEMKRVVQLDLDLKYKSNIRDLFQEFRHFSPEAVIGIVREMQPVYRYTHTHMHCSLIANLVRLKKKLKLKKQLHFTMTYPTMSWEVEQQVIDAVSWLGSITGPKLGHIKSRMKVLPFQSVPPRVRTIKCQWKGRFPRACTVKSCSRVAAVTGD